jgi:hypothetical protein
MERIEGTETDNRTKVVQYVEELSKGTRDRDAVWEKLYQLISQDESLILILAGSDKFRALIQCAGLNEGIFRVVDFMVRSAHYGGEILLSRYPLLINVVLHIAIWQSERYNNHSLFDLVHIWVSNFILSLDIQSILPESSHTLLRESIQAFVTMAGSEQETAERFISHSTFFEALEQIIFRVPSTLYPQRLSFAFHDVFTKTTDAQYGPERQVKNEYKQAIARGSEFLFRKLPQNCGDWRNKPIMCEGMIAGLKEVWFGDTKETFEPDLFGYLLITSMDMNSSVRLAAIGAICALWAEGSRENLENRSDLLVTLP